MTLRGGLTHCSLGLGAASTHLQSERLECRQDIRSQFHQLKLLAGATEVLLVWGCFLANLLTSNLPQDGERFLVWLQSK